MLSELGVVGRVIAVAGAYAKVQLITDARGERRRRGSSASDRQGIVRGGTGELLTLEFVPRQAEVEVGETR